MSNKELRELDAWIAEHVMRWSSCRSGMQSRNDPTDDSWLFSTKPYRTIFKRCWVPTVRSDDAMEVLKKIPNGLDCEDVCLGHCLGMERFGGDWYLYSIYRENRSEIGQWRVNGETLELAICLFAKKLFSKQIPHNESPTMLSDPASKTNHS